MHNITYMFKRSLYLKTLIIIGLLFGSGISVHATDLIPGDSLRTETYHNQKVIIYRVNAKETIYSISRKYHISPKELIVFNNGHQSLRIGDEIMVPLGPASVLPGSSLNDSTTAKNNRIYIVKKRRNAIFNFQKIQDKPIFIAATKSLIFN